MIRRGDLQAEVSSLDWDLASADTQYLTHSIHRYSGKFIPQIARQAIELVTEPLDIVLDPYGGSGTTALEAWLIGRRCISTDINPIAGLISKVKTTPIPKPLITDYVKAIERSCRLWQAALHASEALLNSQLAMFGNDVGGEKSDIELATDDYRMSDPWYQKWYTDPVRLQLILIHNMLKGGDCVSLRNLGLLAFSDVLRRTSNANSSYPNVMFDRGRSNFAPAIPLFLERLREVAGMVARLEEVSSSAPTPLVALADATLLPVPSETVDAVITHPPYIASIPYAEYGVLSLTWLGHDAIDLNRRLTGGRRQSSDVVARFERGFNRMIAESFRVLKPGRHLFMLVGSPTVRGQLVDLADLACRSARIAGFERSAIQHRNGVNRRANKMGHETILFFQKPD